MKQGTKRILMIGFFILIWLIIVFFGYQKYEELQKDQALVNSFNEQINNDEFEISHEDIFWVEETHAEKEEDFDSRYFLPENFETQEGKTLIGEFEGINQINNEIEEEIYLAQENDENQNIQVAIEIEMCGEFPCYTSEQFLEIYNNFETQTGLEYRSKYIYNNKEADDYIRNIAEERGYQRRVFAHESTLVWLNERRTQKDVRDAYISMRDEMQKEDISLHFVSGYRNSSHQRTIFKNKIGDIDISRIIVGDYDQKIDSILEKSSIPAYSKHHSGYAADFGCGNDYLVYSFAETECYVWMSENNFENTKRFGFIPSYPEGVEKQGPNPEPWEFVWVGAETLKTNVFLR